MGYFPAATSALLAGQIVRCAVLVRFDFTTAPRNLWLGAGKLWAGGEYWDGLGELGSVSGIESAIGGTAPVATFRLSGVDAALVPAALASATEVKGRDVTVYLQFFDDEQQTLDEPFSIYAGTLDVMRINAQGSELRTIEVTAETLFARRAMPPWGYLTDRDQQKLFPGDRGLEHVPFMISRTVNWPSFVFPVLVGVALIQWLCERPVYGPPIKEPVLYSVVRKTGEFTGSGKGGRASPFRRRPQGDRSDDRPWHPPIK